MTTTPSPLANGQLQAVLGAIHEGERLLGSLYSDLHTLEDKILRKITSLSHDRETALALSQSADLRKLLDFVHGEGVSTFDSMSKSTKSKLKDIVKLGSSEVVKNMASIHGPELGKVGFNFSSVPDSYINKYVDKMLVEGLPMSTWFANRPQEVVKKVGDLVQQGVRDGLTLPEMTKKMRLDPDFSVVAKEKANAAALVRTSAISSMNDVNIATFRENSDVINGFEWVSTLDKRTTPICVRLDGAKWDLEFNPILGSKEPYPGPIAHWNCRSTQVPIMKTLAELGIESPAASFEDTTRAAPGGQVSASTSARTAPTVSDKQKAKAETTTVAEAKAMPIKPKLLLPAGTIGPPSLAVALPSSPQSSAARAKMPSTVIPKGSGKAFGYGGPAELPKAASMPTLPKTASEYKPVAPSLPKPKAIPKPIPPPTAVKEAVAVAPKVPVPPPPSAPVPSPAKVAPPKPPTEHSLYHEMIKLKKEWVASGSAESSGAYLAKKQEYHDLVAKNKVTKKVKKLNALADALTAPVPTPALPAFDPLKKATELKGKWDEAWLQKKSLEKKLGQPGVPEKLQKALAAVDKAKGEYLAHTSKYGIAPAKHTAGALGSPSSAPHKPAPVFSKPIAAPKPSAGIPATLEEQRAELEKELERLQKLYGSMVEEEGARARELFRRILSRVNPSTFEALSEYTGNAYKPMNALLKNDAVRIAQHIGSSASNMAKYKKMAREAIQALEQLPKYRGTVYRELISTDPVRAAKYRSLKAGDSFSDQGFLSTGYKGSTLLTHSEKPGEYVKMTITSKSGRQIDFLSRNAHENEVLFAPGTKFRVTKAEHRAVAGRSATFLELQEV